MLDNVDTCIGLAVGLDHLKRNPDILGIVKHIFNEGRNDGCEYASYRLFDLHCAHL